MDDRTIVIEGERCRLRAYRADDVPGLLKAAGAFEVARWMTSAFPHPYERRDAQSWVDNAAAENPVDNFVVDVGEEFAGGAGIRPHQGESRGVAEFGYWLGCAHWGHGIATEAAKMLAAHAFRQRGLRRLEAHVFAPNVASARVLEKAGFIREAVLRTAFVERDGTVVDGLLYARLNSDRG